MTRAGQILSRARARTRRALELAPLRRRLGRIRHRLLVIGVFRRTSPYSGRFGYERGTPVDRVYIERFLEANAPDIRGCVLEVGDRLYTERYGASRVVRSDIIDVDEKNPLATFVGDLSQRDGLPENAYDCTICTQVLHLIWDLQAAVASLHALLRPGGVLLLTMPGITQMDTAETRDWYWAVTRHSAARLFAGTFGAQRVRVDAHGNVASAAAFLYGLAAEELGPGPINARDERYDLLVTVRATKASA